MSAFSACKFPALIPVGGARSRRWLVTGVWNKALDQPAHFTVFYGSGQAKANVDKFCLPEL